jgi:hypothetical protein
MAEQKVKLTDLPAATDTTDTAQLLVNQNNTDQKLPVTHFLRAKNNLSDLINAEQARANLNVLSVDEVNDKLQGFFDGSHTFSVGASLALRTDFIWDEDSKSWYYWAGILPKDVPASSSPDSTGGVSSDAWVSIGDATIRQWVKTNYDESTYQQIQTGNFATGTTVTSSYQVVYYPTDGHWYRYLGEIPSDGLIVASNSAPDSNWENVDTQQIISLRKLNELSTSSIAGYVGVNIDMPVSVKDADNQGAKVGNGVSISGDGSSQTSISTTKLQTALRLDGDDITIVNVNGSGNADNTNTSTSEFISSRMAGEVDGRNLKRLTVRGANINGFTTGIALTAINGAIIQDVRARNMRYSPTGLNSAGGYLIVCGGNAKHIITNNIQHTLVEQADRHTLYISAASGDTLGWSYWNISNVDSDYSANSVNNKGANGVPFAMSPIHIRNGKNLNLVNHMVEGYMCSAFDFENQFGSINNTNISNIVATESQSFQNGTLTDQGVLRVGYDQYSSINQHHNFNNFIVKMIRGTDNSGVKMAVGSDNGVWAAKLQFANFVNGQITTESGNAFKLYNSSYVNIDNIIDRQIDTTSSANAIFLSNCSNITIGSNIQSNRTVSSTKERVYTIDTASTEITCRFPRRVVLRVTSGAVTIVEDRWDMLSGVPAISGSNILVPLKNHVSTNSKRTATVENLTAANVKAVRIDDADAVTLRFGLWDTSTNASAPASTASNTVAINFTS